MQTASFHNIRQERPRISDTMMSHLDNEAHIWRQLHDIRYGRTEMTMHYILHKDFCRNHVHYAEDGMKARVLDALNQVHVVWVRTGEKWGHWPRYGTSTCGNWSARIIEKWWVIFGSNACYVSLYRHITLLHLLWPVSYWRNALSLLFIEDLVGNLKRVLVSDK